MKKFAILFFLVAAMGSELLVAVPPEIFKNGYDDNDENATRSTPQFFLDYILDFKDSHDPEKTNIFFDLDGVLSNKTDPDPEVNTVKPRGHMPDIARYLKEIGFKVFILSGWDKFDETVAKVKNLDMEWAFNDETESKETFEDLAPLLKEQEVSSPNMPSDTRYLRTVRQGNVVSLQYVEKIGENYYQSAHRSKNNTPDQFLRAKWMAPQLFQSEDVFFVEDSRGAVLTFQNEIQNIQNYEKIKSLHLFLFSVIKGKEVEGDIISDNAPFLQWLNKRSGTGNCMVAYNESQGIYGKSEVNTSKNNKLSSSSSQISQTPPISIASKNLIASEDSSEGLSEDASEDSFHVGSPRNKNGLPSSSLNTPPNTPIVMVESFNPFYLEIFSFLTKRNEYTVPLGTDLYIQFEMDMKGLHPEGKDENKTRYQLKDKPTPQPENSSEHSEVESYYSEDSDDSQTTKDDDQFEME